MNSRKTATMIGTHENTCAQMAVSIWFRWYTGACGSRSQLGQDEPAFSLYVAHVGTLRAQMPTTTALHGYLDHQKLPPHRTLQ